MQRISWLPEVRFSGRILLYGVSYVVDRYFFVPEVLGGRDLIF